MKKEGFKLFNLPWPVFAICSGEYPWRINFSAVLITRGSNFPLGFDFFLFSLYRV